MKRLILFMITMFPFAAPLFAQEGALAKYGEMGVFGIALGAGLAVGVAALGGGIGQGLTAAAALEGIARNPNAYNKIFTPMILGLVLIESLVIYGLVIAFILSGNLG